jgi:hypothetical protein
LFFHDTNYTNFRQFRESNRDKEADQG